MSKSDLKSEGSSRGISRRVKHGLLAIPLSLSLMGSLAMPDANAADSDDVGFYGSVTIQRAAASAASAMAKGAFGEAQGEYRKAIGFDPNQEDFYFGLYQSSVKMQQWDQVALALEELFNKNPKFKDQMLLEYGECLFHLNRYDEAEPVLKKALAKVTEPSVVDTRIKRLMEKSIIVHAPEAGTIVAYKEPEKYVAPERSGKLEASEVHEHSSTKSLTFLNAWMKCEGVFVAEYKGYEHEGPISFFKPPQANFAIKEYLKGPPLSRTFPVKFEFHSKLGEERPKDWKFSDALMPKKGQLYLIFVPNCVPIDGKFETFHGSYGIQEYSDKTIDEIHKIIEEHQGAAK
ncbi:MAG: tetratricopeptide repeat protein [Candidatus Melainabacteria bacterium]|nr:tetratricopeptide repeat protein [Candidatus Melainabacteria bacterium]